MWKKLFQDNRSPPLNYQIDDFKTLLRYINHLASHKLGYPVSLLTYLGVVNNDCLGIKTGTIANILLNNVGDPFKDSETSLLEVKKHEREIISILEKYYGMTKGEARGYVTTGGTEGNFAGLWWSKRYLINRGLDTLIKHDDSVKLLAKEEQDLMSNLAKIPYNDYQKRAEQLQKILDVKNSISTNKNVVQQLVTPTVFYSSGSTHYSIAKIAEILRLNIRAVTSKSDGGIDLQAFQREILLHLGAHPHSPILIIANIGTTITGAIDDIPGMKKILETTSKNLNYTFHLDGALTGFVMPIIKPFGDIKNYFDDLGVNTLAVSAHKYPGMSQPCGIILATRSFYEMAFAKSERNIDYVGNILDVTISGSRSGLNVLMFYNALRTLGLDRGNEKLTVMVKENLEHARYLAAELTKLYGADQVQYLHHFNVMFPKPSQVLTRKYQLMVTGQNATICVLTNVTKKLIDKFIVDLKLEKETQMDTIKTETLYTIQTLESQHIKSTIDLFIKTFCDSEPTTKHLGISYQDYEPFAREVVQKAVKEGLSKVAIDKQHKVVAFNISEDLADPFIPHVAHYPKLKPIFDLLDQLSKPFMENKKFIKGKIVHVWLAGVESASRGHGLSTQIDMAVVENAARRGFDFAYGEFTNEFSENFRHQFKSYKKFNEINYSDYEYEGQKVFAGVPGHAAAYATAIRPGVNLESLPNCYKVIEHC